MPPACAECDADGEFLASHVDACEQKVRQIDARDREHAGDGASEDEKGVAKTAAQRRVERRDERTEAPAVANRGFAQALADDGEFRLRGGGTDTGFQPADAEKRVAPTGRLR